MARPSLIFFLITSRRYCTAEIATEIKKTKGHGRTGRMDVDEGLPNRILNKAPQAR
jgi:hypothetical protein